MLSRSKRPLLAAFALCGVLAGCGEPGAEPIGIDAAAVKGEAAVAPFEINAAVYWNEVAREMVMTNRSPAPVAIRGYALVSVAQYNAAAAAEGGHAQSDHPSVRAAIGAASVEVLAYLYPAAEAALEARLVAFLGNAGRPGTQHENIGNGESIGRAAAELVIDRAKTDLFFQPGVLTVPTGPGVWFSAAPPVGSRWGEARTWFVESVAALRPPAPPAFGSAAFNADLAEARQISDNRTPEQSALAVYWDGAPGTVTPPGIWNEEAAELAIRYRLSDLAAAHLFALANMVSYDAIVSSHAAKYHYWLLRPTMADPLITTAIPLPNFPSYPSNHAAVSAGMARILGDRFPAERARLDALAEEAAFSRVLGGIHYRFDGDAGVALGRAIADVALAQDVSGRRPFELD